MKVGTRTPQEAFYAKMLKLVDAQRDGEGLTKEELAQKMGFSHRSTVDKWARGCPALNERKVYIPSGDRESRIAVFVSPAYRRKLLKIGPPVAFEKY